MFEPGMGGIADPLHDETEADILWSRVNLSEAVPGVPTPLNWSFWLTMTERSSRAIFHRMGVMDKADLVVPDDPALRYTAIFHGRAAANVDNFRTLMDSVPFTSGDAFELQLLGEVRPDAESHPNPKRYPMVLAKLPRAALGFPKALRAICAETDQWWREKIPASHKMGFIDSIRLLKEAEQIFLPVMIEHGFATMFSQIVYDQVEKLAAPIDPGLAADLSGGYGGMEEKKVVDDLMAVAKGTLPMAAFLAEHGYHGPDEGEMASRSWREDAGPLEALLDSYRRLDDSRSPAGGHDRAVAARQQAETRIMAALGPAGRIKARLVIGLADRYVPLRETGKAAYLKVIDVARAAARRAGEKLAGAGQLDTADDIFFLTLDEVMASPFDGMKALVTTRKTQRARHLAVDIPLTFRGHPVPEPVGGPADGNRIETLKGLGVSRGVIEGPVRVVHDPAQARDFPDGAILVCKTTDPGWAPLFMVAGAIVTDIGGMLSHGAVVARELGVPCIVNTKTGTRDLRDGDIVALDGTTGEITLLLAAPDQG